MKLLNVCLALLLCLHAASWTLEEDDPAIVGVWLLDGDIKDASSNKNDGKIVGNFKFEDGKFGKAVIAAGGGSIDVPESKSLGNVKKELTVAAWFRVDADSDTGVRKNGAYLLEDQSASEPVPDGFSFRVWTTAGITPGFYGKTELEQGKWYHVAGTYDGINVEMYIDGEPESKEGALASDKTDWKPEWNGDVTPGETLQLKFGPELFTGGIDEVVILSRALEQDEIQQLLNGWADAFPVEPEGKLATTWARVKTAR